MNIIKLLKKASDSDKSTLIEFSDGSDLEIDSDLALSILEIYESLDEVDQEEFKDKIEISADDLLSAMNDFIKLDEEQIEYPEESEE